MTTDYRLGWDIGGAQLKVAAVDGGGYLMLVKQLPCPLWKGLAELEQALRQALTTLPGGSRRHAVTMTGELADVFPDRQTGVAEISRCVHKHLGEECLVFAGELSPVTHYTGREEAIASANWLATVQFVAGRLERGIVMDVGSTTTDLIPFKHGKPDNCGYSDQERMRSGELIYTGILRTPVMAVTRQAPLAGEWQSLAAEYFATMGDVYRLTGLLDTIVPPEAALYSSADGRGLTPAECARRLARMFGEDSARHETGVWEAAAGYIAHRQRELLLRAIERVLSRYSGDDMPLVGVGLGQFIVRDLAVQLQRPYVDFADLLKGAESLRHYGAICGPATALAYLLNF